MGATGDVARMLTLVPWLLERPGATLTETAEAFGVGADTIRRDLDHLDFCGLPGLGGGDLFDVRLVGERIVVQMADELRRPLRPTPSEALRLVLTLDAVSEVLGEELPTLRSAVAKVRDALRVPEGAAAVVEPTASTTVVTARRAVTGGHRIRLHYQGRTDDRPQRREVDPWGLHVVDGVWYLQGHDHGARDGRSFRLDRVAGLEVLDEPVQVAAPDVLPTPRYVPGPDDAEVVVETAPSGRWLADALDLDAVDELADGGARLRLRTDAPQWVARLVLMAGGDARVVSPQDLADRVAALVGAALQGYDERGD